MSDRPPEAGPSPYGEPTRVGSVLRVIGGCILVAIVVGIGLWAERATDDDLVLPDEVGGLPMDESPEAREFAEANTERLSEAYADADAATAVYAGDLRILVSAVRAASGPPLPALLEDDQDWVEDDDVTCLVTDASEGDGSTLCQRADGDLTVRAYAEGSTDVDTVVGITDAVWEDLS